MAELLTTTAPVPAVAQVTMMTVEEKPDVTYDDVGGADESLEKLREVVELPLLHPERFVGLGIDPPKVRSTRCCVVIARSRFVRLGFSGGASS